MQIQKMGLTQLPQLPAVHMDENALTILKRRFLKHDDAGNPCETPEVFFWRVAENIARADMQYDLAANTHQTALTFYRMMAELKFLPNSPCLRNAGRTLQQLFACFVLPVDDSLESIFEAIKNMAIVHQSGGGTGFSFSHLRPKNAPIKSSGGVSSGPISFMTVFNAATEAVIQGGTRRGANMGILRIDHPDIESFITCKADHVSLVNFNISVAIDDNFMKAVEANDVYPLVNPHDGKIAGYRNAREIFDRIARNAWENGDPGVIFIDAINNSESNMIPALGKIESTNPCGEQPLFPYEACALGSINLAKFVVGKEIDWESLATTVTDAVHFLDNTIDMNRYPLKQFEDRAKELRRIGLGVMGFADFLIMLEIAYDSERAELLAKEVMQFINQKARKASEDLARKRGAFPLFERSRYHERGDKPLRNVARTTIAPTGNISILAGCSSGIEPLFALVHKRKSLWQAHGAGVELTVIHPLFVQKIRERELPAEKIMKDVTLSGSVAHNPDVPDDLKRVFVTSHDIAPEWHIRIQAAFQSAVNNAVSKTINLPNSATVEDVKQAYLMAYRMGCKGITVYRDGSRSVQVLTTGTTYQPARPVETCVCPECKVPVEPTVGCFKCLACGFSRCA